MVKYIDFTDTQFMPIEPVKIPQNVYVEDRIIGPITLKQIMIVMASSGLSYAIWAMLRANGLTSAVHTFMAWTPTYLGVIFAFVKINGITLFRIMLLLIERLDKPARRVWMPRQGVYVNIVTTKTPEKKEDKKVEKKTHQESQIEELSRVLDQGPPEDANVSEAETSVKPVKPDRIQAEKRKKPVDDIRAQDDDRPQGSGGLLRDISPPPSHA